MNHESSGCYVIDSEYNIVNMNRIAQKLYPNLEIGKKCYACLMGLDSPCGPCPVAAGRKGPATYVDPIRGITEIVDAVDIDIDGIGACHALIFSTVENEASFAATLPTSAQELKDLALIKALSVEYLDVCSVDLSDGSTTMYRLNGKPLAADSKFKETPSYTQVIERYISKYVVEEDRDAMRTQCALPYLAEELKKTESVTLHYRVLLDGEVHYYYRTIVRIGEPDSFTNIVVGIGCEDEAVEDRNCRIRLETTLSKVEKNAATGLLTKEAFIIHAARMLQENPDTEYDFGILNIENMESIHRQYGPLVGEQFLRDVGDVMRRMTPDNMCSAYLGGNLFGCICVEQDEEGRKKTITLFREEVEKQSKIRNYAFRWSFYKHIQRDVPMDTLIDAVIRMLSMLRPGIPGEYFEFDREVMANMEWEMSVEQNFRHALKNGEFVAWFQPKYSVDTRRIEGAEALVRWISPNGTVIPPDRFIPILENCGLIDLLDEEIFRQVCQFQKELGEYSLPISVNLSRASMFMHDIPKTYLRIAREYGVDPALIPIEITESAAIRATMFRSFAEELIGNGFCLHMDDFGAGYSSLASVQMIPFQCIKLDKSLVDFIGKRSGESLLKHTIEFAKENGMRVIAEGVETEEQRMFLRIVGCDLFQGFLYSKAVDKDTFRDMLATEA